MSWLNPLPYGFINRILNVCLKDFVYGVAGVDEVNIKTPYVKVILKEIAQKFLRFRYPSVPMRGL